MMIEARTLYPVILTVPKQSRKLQARSKVASLSRHAREALEISAQKSGFQLGKLSKNANGSPLPSNGIYWSLTHKPSYVGAVVAPTRVGIDIEKIRSRSRTLFKKTANPAEWALADNDSWEQFFRYWTSKEAALKAAGTGLKDLSKCRVIQIIDKNNLLIKYWGQQWHIEHFFFNGHVASVVKNTFNIQWTLL
jgi:4'-phosphopantetheinyl transferase